MRQNGKRNSFISLCLLLFLGSLLIVSLLPHGTATAQDQAGVAEPVQTVPTLPTLPSITPTEPTVSL